MMTGYASLDNAKKAMKYGAVEYIEKPFDLKEIRESIRKRVEEKKTSPNLAGLGDVLSSLRDIHNIRRFLVTSGKSLNDMLEHVFHLLLKILDGDSGSLMLVDRDTDGLSFAAEHGLASKADLNAKIKLGDKIAGWVAQSGEGQLLVGDLQNHPLFSHLPSRKELSSALCVPLRIDEKVIGVVNINRSRSANKAIYTRKELDWLSAFAKHCALAIANARLVDELQTAYLELKSTQAQLVHAQKIHALGELTAGVAHELNQPLCVIKIISQATLRDMERGQFKEEDLAQNLPEVVNQVNKMAEIIDHMRVFTRRSEGRPLEKTELNSVIEGTLKFLGQQLKDRNIELTKALASDLPRVTADPIRLEEAFLNLISNARNALESSGKQEKKIEVKDNAGGIPQALKEKIFEPFFTTSEPGKGTGLGLSVTSKIVEEHKGRIELESKLGEGSTFRIVLPAQG
jgi:signal transduction histidine kinase